MGWQFPIEVRVSTNGAYILQVGTNCIFIEPSSLNEVIDKLQQAQKVIAQPPKKV